MVETWDDLFFFFPVGRGWGSLLDVGALIGQTVCAGIYMEFLYQKAVYKLHNKYVFIDTFTYFTLTLTSR